MRMRYRMVLPIIGLCLFAGVSYNSFRLNRQIHSISGSNRYFWWGSVRLDSDPLSKRLPQRAAPCNNAAPDCATKTADVYVHVHPGWITMALALSGFPAFLAGVAVVKALGHTGVSEVWSFMVSMPLLLFAWYYFAGWLVDRWRYKRQHRIQKERGAP